MFRIGNFFPFRRIFGPAKRKAYPFFCVRHSFPEIFRTCQSGAKRPLNTLNISSLPESPSLGRGLSALRMQSFSLRNIRINFVPHNVSTAITYSETPGTGTRIFQILRSRFMATTRISRCDPPLPFHSPKGTPDGISEEPEERKTRRDTLDSGNRTAASTSELAFQRPAEQVERPLAVEFQPQHVHQFRYGRFDGHVVAAEHAESLQAQARLV